MTDRLTKFNAETGEYEYRERAKTQGEFAAQRKAVIQRLGEFEDRAKWVDIKDRLPEVDTEVLAYVGKYNSIQIMSLDKNNRWWDYEANAVEEYWRITHWMPLPQPPKMKGEKR